ncbi:SDR family oxidoreductase [Pontibacillus sp. ALD_SL1]|uniref:NAD(P)-dependent oxidoreductase n=1 Tax=Pontibacillus sp. ALD_SL1 TaxID=2777185 RepID=UPI001A9788A6|nr:SDR family oxidoreductase [Pontibacillus sp. ALD_SL1]QSS99502.1 SDR family oxidoreductase [Pontibacillus sp. ALD_SL1]
MNIIVFGATGGTGKLVVKQLLEEGHEVTVVVRDERRLKLNDHNLTIVQGDVLEPSSFEDAMEGKEAVISALGVSHRKPTTVYSEGTENILNVMEAHGISRMICLSSGTIALPPDTPFLAKTFINLTIKQIYRNLYKDMERMERIVSGSNVDWTIIRPPRLTDGTKTLEYRVTINEPMKNAKGIKGISRADLADCMVKQLNNPPSYKGFIDISY